MHDAGHATGLPREADAVSAIAEAYLAQAGAAVEEFDINGNLGCQRAPKSPRLWASKIPDSGGLAAFGDQPLS